jgi:hypothetical protein
MIHKIIKTDDYLLVLGKNYKSDSFPYLVAEKLTTGDYQLWQVDNPNDVDEPNQFEILSHLPLNGSPILKDVSLLPPIEDDNVEQLAYKWFVTAHKKKTIFDLGWVNIFTGGYNKAREKYKYTEEDVRHALFDLADVLFNNCQHGITEEDCGKYQSIILQSLHQYPTEFECETEPYTVGEMSKMPLGTVNQKPKTITTDQGIQWVGKYL